MCVSISEWDRSQSETERHQESPIPRMRQVSKWESRGARKLQKNEVGGVNKLPCRLSKKYSEVEL